jgi:acetyl esterase
MLAGAPRRSPEGIALDLQSQAMLKLARLGGEEEEYDDVESARQHAERSWNLLAPRGGGDVHVRDRMIPGGEGPRRARVYTPARDVGRGSGCAPGIVWFHAGGFVLGSLETHDGICGALAMRAGVVVLSVDYRLAPEHPFPAAVDDALAAARWVLGHGAAVGIDVSAVAVGGDSAGGNLAAVTAYCLRGAPRQPVFQLLVYPSLDATCREPSHRYFADGLVLTEQAVGWFLSHYLPNPGLVTDPRVSPLLAPDLSGLPPALLVTAGFDPLRDEGRAYAERMRLAGVRVEHVCSQGSVHGYLATAGAIRESRRMLRLVAERLKRGLSEGSAAA